MLSMNGLRIRSRLYVAFAIVVSLTIFATAYGQWQLADVQHLATEIAVNQAERSMLAERLRQDIAVGSTRTLMLGNLSNPTLVPLLVEKIMASNKSAADLRSRLTKAEVSVPGRALLAELDKVAAVYIAQCEGLMKTSKGPPSIAEAIQRGRAVAAFGATSDAYLAAVDKLVEFERQRAKADGDRIGDAVHATATVALACAGVSVAASLALCLLLSGSIVKPIHALQALADRISGGDLRGTAARAGSDEVGQLAGSLGNMREALHAIVHEIRECASSMLSATSQVAAGNQDLSARTERTAGSLQQAASSMASLTETVRHGAEFAAQARALASHAQEIADTGGSVVTQVVSKMQEIDANSKRISNIVATIDSLAFQTNILALNASIEAARAGERGRGFAVVAGEVRMLSHRCAGAAQEIKELIEASVTDVELGASLARTAGETMERIMSAVRGVGAALGEITSAADEQASGIGHINDVVVHVDEMTQQNAALVEQSAAAAESMSEQARRLDRAVERFVTR